MEKLNVAIADDNEKMLDLLGNLINEDKELELVGHANNGADIYDIIREKEPDVVLLDIIMPKVDGLSVMERVGRDGNLKNIPLLSWYPLSDRSRSQKMPLIWGQIIIL